MSRLLVSLPEPLAAEAVRARLAERAIERRAGADTLLLIVGVGGSIVSLAQAPLTVREFAKWLAGRFDRGADQVVSLQLRRGTKDLKVDIRGDTDEPVIANVLLAVIDDWKQT
jgi:hypothetical protein